MKLATNNKYRNVKKIGVLLESGRYSNSFDYLDGNNLGVDIGDIVLVKLRGRLCSGLAVTKSLIEFKNNNEGNENAFKYLFIERIIQKRIFDDDFGTWLTILAGIYKVSLFKSNPLPNLVFLFYDYRISFSRRTLFCP